MDYKKKVSLNIKSYRPVLPKKGTGRSLSTFDVSVRIEKSFVAVTALPFLLIHKLEKLKRK
jgi:hypothetical protein